VLECRRILALGDWGGGNPRWASQEEDKPSEEIKVDVVIKNFKHNQSYLLSLEKRKIFSSAL
jgi:hypothetical protein